MSEAVEQYGEEEDSEAFQAQEDFREFIEQEAVDWGDDELNEGALEEVEEGEELEEEEEPAVNRGSRREGTDDVLRRLDESDPEAARVVRDMQRKMSQNINEFNTLKSEILDIREQMLSQRGAVSSDEGEDTAESSLPEGITESHLDMFRKMADHLGYVPRQELEQRDTENKAESFVQSSMRQAFERFGNRFGFEDESGNIQIHPDVRERLNKRMEALRDPTRGVTPLDLFLIEFSGEARPTQKRKARPAQQPARREQQPQQQEQRRRPSPNSAVRRSSSGRSALKIYDPKRGDSAEDVFDRAFALSKRQLSGA